MTTYDYFKVKSSFWSNTEKKVSCYSCKLRKDHEKIKLNQGCNENRNVVVFPTDDFKYYGCIGKFKDFSFETIKRMYDFFKIGINPYGGNIVDTPNKLVEIGLLIDNLIDEKLKEEHDKRSKAGHKR